MARRRRPASLLYVPSLRGVLIATTILPPPVVPQIPSRRTVAAVIETDRRTSGAGLTAGLDVAGLAALVFAGALLAALGALLHERRDVTG